MLSLKKIVSFIKEPRGFKFHIFTKAIVDPGAGSGSFGPPGSGSVSQRSGSFYRQAKIVRKLLNSCGFVTSVLLFIFENIM